jgi:hypothetical protein
MFKFLKLEPGSNRIRILTTPYQYYSHDNLIIKGKQPFEQKLKCPTALLGLENVKCKICLDGHRSKPRWMLGVVSYKDNESYLLDIDHKYFSKLRDLARHLSWGDPTKYDIDFVVNNYCESYSIDDNKVIPIPHSDFDNTKYLDQIDIKQLSEMCKPSLEDLDIIESNKYEEIVINF